MARRAQRTALAALVFGMMGITGANGQDQPLPDASQVIDRFIEASGGQEAFRKLHNRVIKAKFEAGARSGDMVIYEAAPSKSYTFTRWMDGSCSEVWTDGKVVWERGSNGATKMRQGLARDEQLHRAQFNREARWKDLHNSAEMQGTAEVNGQLYYKVGVEPLFGEPEVWFLNQSSGLHERTESFYRRGGGLEVPVITIFGDYKPVDGVLRYHHLEQQMGFTKFTIIFESMQYNVDQGDVWTLPKEIQNLIDAKQGTGVVDKGRLRLIPPNLAFEDPLPAGGELPAGAAATPGAAEGPQPDSPGHEPAAGGTSGTQKPPASGGGQ